MRNGLYPPDSRGRRHYRRVVLRRALEGNRLNRQRMEELFACLSRERETLSRELTPEEYERVVHAYLASVA